MNTQRALPLGWFDSRSAAPLSRVVVGDVREIQGAVAYLTAKLVTSIVVPLGVAIGMLFVDWRIAVSTLVAAPVLFAVNRLGNRAYVTAEERTHAAATEADTRVVEFAQAQPVLRAFGAVGRGNRALDSALEAQKKSSTRNVTSAVTGIVLFGLVVQAVFLALTYVVVGQVTGGAVTAAAAVALIAVSARFIEPLNQAAQLAGALRSASSSVDRASELLPEPVLAESDSSITVGTPGVKFDAVSFGYDADSPVLSDIAFTVPAGTTTAIVGPSGAGKTTLLRLVARYADVDSGSITVGGHDVRQQPSSTLLDQLSLVFQNPYLFDRSIAENIRIGRPATTLHQRTSASNGQVSSLPLYGRFRYPAAYLICLGVAETQEKTVALSYVDVSR